MALNLSTLTNPATSGGILAEALTTADFLDPVPILKNLSRGSNKGGDAKQTTGLNQPKALPLIDGDGYLYVSGVNGNYASVPDESALDVTGDLTIEIDVTVSAITPQNPESLLSKYNTNTGNRSYDLALQTDGKISLVISSDGSFQPSNSSISTNSLTSQGIVDGQRITIKATWRQSDGRVQIFYKTRGGDFTQLGINLTANAGSIYNSNTDVNIGAKQQGTSTTAKAAIHSAKIYASINETNKVLDVDFTATNIRHGDTKFKCATGQVVTINQSGNDPATIIKKSVLRFDGSDDGLQGLFGQTITEGYLFASFSVLGSGGDNYARLFIINPTGGTDAGHFLGFRLDASNTFRSDTGGSGLNYSNMYDEERGDVLYEYKFKSGDTKMRFNNATGLTSSGIVSCSAQEFSIAASEIIGDNNAALDLEYLALFPASITDDQAADVVNYINNRNNVFSLIDSQGYYFFDPQKASFTGNFTGANTLDGYITGSDNGDTDVRSNLTLEQSTLNDQPSTDGYTITFNDAAEHLEFENAASQNLTGWQVCGTSLGTFVYRVQGAVTELNLLGNAGAVRSIGDLYGIILLPASATGKDIEDARKLLIDRGAADGATVSSYQAAWYLRSDIKEFKSVNMTEVTNVESAWNSSGLISFSTPLPSATNARFAFYNSTQLSDFRTTDIKDGTDFTGCWQNCSSLQSFPAGAKLGTSASNVNFTSAWQQSGLTSFPALDLSRGNDFTSAFQDSSSLATIGAGVLLGTASASVNFTSTFQGCGNLVTLPANLNLSQGDDFAAALLNCYRLVTFPAGSFDTMGPPSNYCFLNTWLGCSALSATSVFNILSSIDTSTQSAPSNGPQIVIDYNGDPLSAATNAAVDSLKTKGWVIVVNGVTL